MFSSSKGKSKKKASATVVKSLKCMYDYNEKELSRTMEQINDLKRDAIVILHRIRKQEDFSDKTMYRILLEPKPSPIIHQLFRRILVEEGNDVYTEPETGESAGSVKGKEVYVNTLSST
ncbi:hypothetical protein ACFE04_014368 [Oxalis oulophora]